MNRLAAMGVLAALAITVAGCGATESSPRTDRATLRVDERDFRISAPRSVRAGDVNLEVRNSGPDHHELLLVRTRSARALRMSGDGMTVDEQAVEPSKVTAIEPQPAHTVTRRVVHLTPGRYVLLCNMSGNFRGGMRTSLVAR